jgi:hypothetical protein
MSGPRLIRETLSAAGRRVTLIIEHPAYPGGQPLYVIARCKAGGGPEQLRYIPLTYGLDPRRPLSVETRRAQAQARAEAIFEAFGRDVTEPKELGVDA